MSPEPDAHSRSENDTVVRFEAINPGPTLSAEALDAYCAREGIRLPEPLRQQLLEQNAGAPRSECYVTLPGGREEEVFSFFGVDMPDRSSELGWIARTFEGRLPARMLPFADDPAGNLFLLDEDGSVWLWEHELEGRPDAIVRVTDSLDEFLKAISPGPA